MINTSLSILKLEERCKEKMKKYRLRIYKLLKFEVIDRSRIVFYLFMIFSVVEAERESLSSVLFHKFCR